MVVVKNIFKCKFIFTKLLLLPSQQPGYSLDKEDENSGGFQDRGYLLFPQMLHNLYLNNQYQHWLLWQKFVFHYHELM